MALGMSHHVRALVATLLVVAVIGLALATLLATVH